MLISCASASDAPPSRETLAASSAAPLATPIVVHWMSWSGAAEPRYRLLYEGGDANAFTQLRLIDPNGTIVLVSGAVPSASEALRMCGGGGRSGRTSYGALRVTLIVPTQELLGDVIRRPDTYRVEVLINGIWSAARAVEECHAQVD